MSIGDPPWAPWILDSDTALPLLKAAYDRGINAVEKAALLEFCFLRAVNMVERC